MEKCVMALLCLMGLLFHCGAAISAGTSDGLESWGYAKVRPKVNVFWWYYRSPQRVSTLGKPWPIILWLQGGPAVMDMIRLLKILSKEIPALQTSPMFIVGESYGWKLAAMIGVSLARAIRTGTLKLWLGGVVLGDGWISPEDFAVSYAQLLHDVSRLNDNAVKDTNKMAATVKKQTTAGQFAAAQKTWTDLLSLIDSESDSVNMDNFLLDTGMNPVLARSSLRGTQLMFHNSHTSQLTPNTIEGIMNGVIKEKLKIIPKSIVWKEATLEAYEALANDFMKPAIHEARIKLLSFESLLIDEYVLDVICPTIGVEQWVKKLKWKDLKKFLSLRRQPLHYCDSVIYCSKESKAYVRSYKNLHMYWILQAGHMVPVDQPYSAFRMIASTTE
uniref:Carboxypeptidase n=1 Tax=Leersia perrieri TaxID=77586 RepID=A0A0D9VG44_9ORYZ